eukprot:TRINITY_DN37964_c0_g1_i1.p1 TRINITY_DN37964_c0_g1~~TRINITY_DN37964_c0_g1_i1.p1  ORF type:complete len:344 (-),score=63.86 TRINITY_DN37964_c0_g1_i1:163-1194(-)
MALAFHIHLQTMRKMREMLALVLFSLVLLKHQIFVVEAVAATRLRLPYERATGRGPLIGIVSHPGDGASNRLSKDPNVSYIASSYVKFIESGGARVVPFIYNEPAEILEQKFQAVNGLLFPGGWDKYGPLHDTVEKLFQRALEENDKGKYFPVHATCLGFEIVTMVVSKNRSILESFDASNYPCSLTFKNEAAKNSSIFQWLSPEVVSRLSSLPILMDNHKYGISPERFSQDAALSKFFRILTTGVDRKNKEYVSTVEAYNYPVTATQWHPEKNAFEWQIPNIPHSADAVEVTQGIANFLISEARKSDHQATEQEEQEYLIYNYPTYYSGKVGGSFDEVYLFR